jgi:superfamily II DNA/RNA helicase
LLSAVCAHDLIGIAQTGTGKTAAFMLPILTKLAGAGRGAPGIRVLVLVPTRELAAQIEENVNIYAKHLNIRCATIFGGVGERPLCSGALALGVAKPCFQCIGTRRDSRCVLLRGG